MTALRAIPTVAPTSRRWSIRQGLHLATHKRRRHRRRFGRPGRALTHSQSREQVCSRPHSTPEPCRDMGEPAQMAISCWGYVHSFQLSRYRLNGA